jgi:hypothetical protein
MTISKSPERNTFQRDCYIKQCKEEGREPDPSIVQMYNKWTEESEYENRPENDLEYDLRTCEWILEKARKHEYYAQNIYAALCNMRWQKLDTFPILKDEYWTCSWRHAGGVVADMLQKGDYIDWYCSGIQDYSSDQADPRFNGGGYVPEGTVTEEIRIDFQKIGWIPSEWPEDSN